MSWHEHQAEVFLKSRSHAEYKWGPSGVFKANWLMTNLNSLFRSKPLRPNKWDRYVGSQSPQPNSWTNSKSFFGNLPTYTWQLFFQMGVEWSSVKRGVWARFLSILWRMPGFLPACHTYKAYGWHLNWQRGVYALQHSWEGTAKDLLQPSICKEPIWHIPKGIIAAHSFRCFKFHHSIRLAHEIITFVDFTILNFCPAKFLKDFVELKSKFMNLVL